MHAETTRRHAPAQRTQTPSEPGNPARLTAALDAHRLQAIEDLADLAASCARSIGESAWRHEARSVAAHTRSFVAVARELAAIVKQLGSAGL